MTLPPGRARLVTNPVATGSGTVREDDRNNRGRLLGGQSGSRARGHNDIHLERNQFGRKGRERLELSLGIAVFDHDVTALDVTEVTQSLTESFERALVGKIARKVAYSGNLGRLLGVRGERPRHSRSSDHQSHKITAPHVGRPGFRDGMLAVETSALIGRKSDSLLQYGDSGRRPSSVKNQTVPENPATMHLLSRAR